MAEIWFGVLGKHPGKRRRQLKDWFAGPEGPQALFAGRVLPFDDRAALVWGRLMADRRAAGRSPSALDTIIAAVASANGCIVVTDNERDFTDVPYINPLRASR